MKNAPSLDEKILAVLTGPCTSIEASGTRDAAERKYADLNARADEADTASMNPLLNDAEAGEPRRKADDLRFEADRYGAKVTALSARVANLLDQERQAGDSKEREAAIAERDELAVDIARDYPRIVAEITRLVQRIIQSDARAKAAGHLPSAEMIARRLGGNFTHADGVSGALRLQNIKLPLLDRPGLAFEATTSGGWRFPGLVEIERGVA